MTSFNKFINGTDPNEPEEAYGYMKGNDALSSNGGDLDTPPLDNIGVRTRFYNAGDPVKVTGWLDSSPSDRRFMCNTGPFTFNPDDTQTVVAAVIVGNGMDRLSSITSLKNYSTIVQYAYDINFKLQPIDPYIELHHVEGLNIYGEMMGGQWATIYLRVANNGDFHDCMDNCFAISSPDGAEWGTTIADTLQCNLRDYFDSEFGIDEYDIDGKLVDKIGFHGISSGDGLPAGFDDVIYKITIGPISEASVGRTIVLDSCPDWNWCPGVKPNWRGPYVFKIAAPSDVTEIYRDEHPDNFRLMPNYPNPFNSATNIEFSLPRSSDWKLTIYNIVGQAIETFEDHYEAGLIQIKWDASDFASGIYLYRLQAGEFNEIRKMVLLK